MGRWFAYTGNADKIVIDYFEVAWAKGSRWDKNALLMGPDWRRILDEQFPGLLNATPTRRRLGGKGGEP